MVPSIWSSCLLELSPEDAVVALAGRGWFHTELSSEHSEALMARGEPTRTGQAFRTFAESHGMSVPQGHLSLLADVCAPEGRQPIEQLKRWLDLYMALGIRAAVIHPGGEPLLEAGADAEKVLDMQVRGFTELTGHVRGSGTVICLENVGPTGRVEDLCRIIDACGTEHLGICLDTGHLNLIGGDPAAFIRAAGPLLNALHLADNDGSGDQHLLPCACGTVEWDGVVPALRKVAYEGPFNFEIPGETRQCPLPVRMAKLDCLKVLAEHMLAGNPLAGTGRAGDPAMSPGHEPRESVRPSSLS